MKAGKQTNAIVVVRESIALPLLIVLYGVPAVLAILLLILVGLGIQFGIRMYREKGRNTEQLESIEIEEESAEFLLEK